MGRSIACVYKQYGALFSLKKKKILSFGTTWFRINLEGAMLSNICQKEEDKYFMVSLICGEKKKEKKNSTPRSKTEKQLLSHHVVCFKYLTFLLVKYILQQS